MIFSHTLSTVPILIMHMPGEKLSILHRNVSVDVCHCEQRLCSTLFGPPAEIQDTFVVYDCSSWGMWCCLKGTILTFDSLTNVAMACVRLKWVNQVQENEQSCTAELHDTIVVYDCSSWGMWCCFKGTILTFDSLTNVAIACARLNWVNRIQEKEQPHTTILSRK